MHVHERRQKLRRAAQRLQVELGRDPSLEELAKASGLRIDHVTEALGAADASVSLNQAIGSDGDGELADLFADTSATDPVDEAHQGLRERRVREVLADLPERQRYIVERRFGLSDAPRGGAGDDRQGARHHPRARPTARARRPARLQLALGDELVFAA